MSLENNTPIPDAELAELRRLREAVANGLNWQEAAQFQALMVERLPAILARLEAAEREREELRRKNAAKEDWLRAWMQYLWDGKPDATARERFIADVESRFMGGEFDSLVWLAARDVQQRREALREAAKEIQGVTDSIVWCDSELQGRQSVIDRLMEMASELEAANGY